MALLTDDMDIETTYLRVLLGGNGDYYPQIMWVDDDGIRHFKGMRISTSGGNAPTDVKIAIAELYRALEKHGLNEHPIDDDNMNNK